MNNNEIHYSDHSFQKLCEEEYGINRGVYNTIDAWFFETGVENIINRRKEILCFLRFINSNNSSKIKFGNGGLVIKLKEFWVNQNLNSKNTS